MTEPASPICPNTTRCPVFPLFRSEAALATLKTLYCEMRWETCQRFQSLERGVIPPQDLLPNGKRFPRG